MKTYIALTIGPIYKTLSNARRTQELWASSYMFSYIMREIIKRFRHRTFVVPFVKNDVLDTDMQAGLFHDRFVFESEEGDSELIKDSIKEVIEELADNLAIDYDYLQQYLQIHYREFNNIRENPIIETTGWLDSMELKYQVAPVGENKLKEALRNKENYFKKKIFPGMRPFPSLPEIALHDEISDAIRDRINRDDDEFSIYEDAAFRDRFKPYHKYIAIVHADGDNMGKVVKSLNMNEFTDFSKNLFTYSTQSIQSIEEYGGEVIYAGGDDLLFFAPVANMSDNEIGTTIFALLENISKIFDGLFAEYNKNLETKTTLSFGVSITYHKFPLYEALENSRLLLFDKAKNTGDKNNIAFSIIKHSGQTFGAVVSKSDTDIYQQLLSLMNATSRVTEDGNFLHSLHHKLYTYRVLIDNIANDEEKLTNFFVNFFSKDLHRQFDIIFAAMVTLIHASYAKADSNELAMGRVYSALRFIKFLKGDKS